jgi:hypothetical protein
MARKPSKFKIYDTMGQFCEGEGVHPAMARRAKAENCPHVKPGGRFDSRAAAWIRKQGWDEVAILNKEQLECKRIEKQNRKLDFEHQVRLGEFERVDVVKASWARAMEAVMAVMQKLMPREDYNCAIRQIKVEIRALNL